MNKEWMDQVEELREEYVRDLAVRREMEAKMRGTYFRWSQTTDENRVSADILGTNSFVTYDIEMGKVWAELPTTGMTPDEARMYGVRLIEAATRAEGDRLVRG